MSVPCRPVRGTRLTTASLPCRGCCHQYEKTASALLHKPYGARYAFATAAPARTGAERQHLAATTQTGEKQQQHQQQQDGVDSPGIAQARLYCNTLLRKYDNPAYILQTFIPSAARDAYLALRALNVETARIPDVTSNPAIGAMRMQFWRDAVRKVLGSPDGNRDDTATNTLSSAQKDGRRGSKGNPGEPVITLLDHAVTNLRARYTPSISTSTSPLSLSSSPSSSPSSHLTTTPLSTWSPLLNRLLAARTAYLDKRPYPTLDALESYAEDTYSVLMYLSLSALPVSSVQVDHIASHIGKAAGIVAVLRGLPWQVFPSVTRGPDPLDASATSLGSSNMSGNARAGHKQGTLPLPLSTLAAAKVREEDVFRLGASAPNLKDAVFTVATRAHDHLLTAQDMLNRAQAEADAEAEAEAEAARQNSKPSKGQRKKKRQRQAPQQEKEEEGNEGDEKEQRGATTKKSLSADMDAAFSVFVQAVPLRLWLEKLQKSDFDVFAPGLRGGDWRLPWKAYWAFTKKRVM